MHLLDQMRLVWEKIRGGDRELHTHQDVGAQVYSQERDTTGEGQKGHLVTHFQRHGIQNLKVCGLEHDPGWGKRDRLKREWYLINKLDTWFPKGLNMRSN